MTSYYKKDVGKVTQSLHTFLYYVQNSCVLRRNIDIKGIELSGSEQDVSQYAGDTAVFIE